MKKPILVICTLFLSLSAFTQSFTTTKTSDSPETSTLEVTNPKKPLIVIDYKSEKISLRSSSKGLGLSDIELHHVERFEVIKGATAEAKFGKNAEDGVILLYLKKNKAAKLMFRDLKKQVDNEVIDVAPHAKVDTRTGYGVETINKSDIRNSQELAKTSENRPSFRSLNEPDSPLQLRARRISPSAIFIMSLDGKERYINSSLDFDDLTKNGMKSIEILKDDKSKDKYNSNGKEIVIVTFERNKETKKLFRKLKKVKQK